MLVKYFHTNKPAVLLILPLFLIGLWFPFWFYQTVPKNELVSPFVLLFKKDLILDGIPGMAAAALTCLLCAILLNRIIINSELSNKPTYIYAFSYVLAESFLRTDAGFYTWQVSQFMMIWALWPLLLIFNQRHVINLSFQAGLITGIAFLVCPPSLPFFLIIYFFLQRFRPFSWREWLFPLIGFGLVLLFYCTWCLINDRQLFLVYLVQKFDYRDFYNSQPGTLILLGLIGLVSLVTYLRAAVRAINQARKQRLVILYLFIIFVLSTTLLNLNGITHIGYYFTCFQLTLFMGHFFGHTRTRWLAEVLFLVACTLIICRYAV